MRRRASRTLRAREGLSHMDAHDQGTSGLTGIKGSDVVSADVARAPTPPLSVVHELVHGTHHDLVHLHRLLARAVRKERWARVVAKQNAQLKSVMCAVKRALGDGYRRRENGPNRTRLFYVEGETGAELLAAVFHCTTPKRMGDFDAPIRVEVLAPSAMDLSELSRRGDVELVF